jgi:hypothetical protein
MTRRLRILNVATALSIFLCVSIMALWVRSEFRHDDVGWRHGEGFRSLGSVLGRLSFDDIDQWRQPTPLLVGYRASPIASFERSPNQPWTGRYWWGFQWYFQPDRPNSMTGRMWFVVVPYWFLLLLALPLPLLRAVKFWRVRRRAQKGHCAACGYDLRATPGRCPECGRIAAVETV